MRGVFFKNWYDNTGQVREWFSFADLASWIAELPPFHGSDKRDSPAFSPVEYLPGMSRKKQGPNGKDLRPDQRVANIQALMLDFDGESKQGVTFEQRAELEAYFANVNRFVYTTFSHREVAPNGRSKFRIVLELSRLTSCDEHARIFALFMCELPVKPDKQCSDPTRIYGLSPRHSDHDFVDVTKCAGGVPLDVEGLLSIAPQVAKPAPATVVEASVDRKSVEARMKKIAGSSRPHEASIGRLLLKVLKGEPYATVEGERHETALALTARLDREFPHVSCEALAALFHPSVTAMGVGDPSWDIEERLADILRLLEGARVKREDFEAEAQTAAETKREHAIAKARGDGKTTPYDETDRAELAKIASCDVTELDKHWIVGRVGTYYVNTLEGFVGPYAASDAHVVAGERLIAAGVSLSEPTREGKARKYTIKELHDLYGRVASKIILDTSNERSFFDKDLIMHERACPMREVNAAYSEEIDAYLRVFAGSHYEKLCDWFATAHDLSRPTCALYLHGKKGTGKTFIATMVATIWSAKGSVVEMDRAIGHFNARLVDTPVVLVDEGLPDGATSNTTRSMVASSQRTINRKSISEAEMHGCLRVVIATNNSNVLNFSREDLTNDDIEAISDRFEYIKVADAAADYLHSIGGRDRTTAWVESGIVAAHIAWLRETRQVKTDARWLVKGDAGPLLTKMATQNGWRPKVCQWLCGYLNNPGALNIGEYIKVAPYARVDANGDFWVNANAIEKAWMAYVTDSQYNKISLPKAGTTLGALCHSDPEDKPQLFKIMVNGEMKESRFYRVNLPRLFEWAKDSGVFEVAELKASIETLKAAAIVAQSASQQEPKPKTTRAMGMSSSEGTPPQLRDTAPVVRTDNEQAMLRVRAAQRQPLSSESGAA